MKHTKKGFTLLIAILASSLFLVIGATIFKIAFTQLTLSSIGKDSQVAFYAADTGAECALYWERKYYPGGDDGSGSAFNTDVLTHNAYDTSNRELIRQTLAGGAGLPNIQCLGGNVQNFKQGYVDGTGTIDATSFQITFGRTCVDVDILKSVDAGNPVTTITARGHNTCDITDMRRVERTLQIILK